MGQNELSSTQFQVEHNTFHQIYITGHVYEHAQGLKTCWWESVFGADMMDSALKHLSCESNSPSRVETQFICVETSSSSLYL